jgi:hypothetical protein
MRKKTYVIIATFAIMSLVLGGSIYMLMTRSKPNLADTYPPAVLGAKQGFVPLIPKNMKLVDSSFTNGVLIFSVTDAHNNRFVITEQNTPNGFTSDSFRGSRSIPTLYGIAKSTNLNGSTTVSLITTSQVMLTITSTPAVSNEYVDALLTSLAELKN